MRKSTLQQLGGSGCERSQLGGSGLCVSALRLLLPLLLPLPLPLPAAVPPDLFFGLELDKGGAPTAGDDGALEAPSLSGALEHMAHCLHLQ